MVYLYKMKLQMQVYLTYRFEVFASFLTRFLLIIANVFLWTCVYSNQQTISEVSKNQMLTYSVLSACLSVMYQCGIQSKMNSDVRQGNIAILLMRPFHLLVGYFAEDIGMILVKTVTIAFPVFLVGNLLLPMEGPASLLILPLILLSYVFGFLILWLLSTLVAMFTFVTMELGNMGVLKDTIVAILSGSMIPIWFFPEKAEKLLMKTPFPYTYQTPLGLYIGKIGVQEGIRQIAMQVFWLVLLYAVVVFTWKKVQSKVLIQGG